MDATSTAIYMNIAAYSEIYFDLIVKWLLSSSRNFNRLNYFISLRINNFTARNVFFKDYNYFQVYALNGQ